LSLYSFTMQIPQLQLRRYGSYDMVKTLENADFAGYNQMKGESMQVVNLKDTGAKIPNLYQYEIIATMNNHNFTLVMVKDRTLGFHIHPDSDEVFISLRVL
jgi:hypothetical protein